MKMDISRAKASGCAPIIFAFVVFWLFIFSDMDDDLRYGSGNMFVFFGLPFWIAACVASRFAVYGLWRLFPALAPRPLFPTASFLMVLFGVVPALAAACAWYVSPFFILVHSSSKIILLILVTGLMLGMIGKVGGRISVLVSLAAGLLSAVAAFLVTMVVARVWGGSEDLWNSTWVFASLGVPFAVSVTLFQCYQRASARV